MSQVLPLSSCIQIAIVDIAFPIISITAIMHVMPAAEKSAKLYSSCEWNMNMCSNNICLLRTSNVYAKTFSILVMSITLCSDLT